MCCSNTTLARVLLLCFLRHTLCCSVLQCVAVCCSVLQCVAVCCSVLQCVTVCCNVLQPHDAYSRACYSSVSCSAHCLSLFRTLSLSLSRTQAPTCLIPARPNSAYVVPTFRPLVFNRTFLIFQEHSCVCVCVCVCVYVCACLSVRLSTFASAVLHT